MGVYFTGIRQLLATPARQAWMWQFRGEIAFATRIRTAALTV